MALLQRVKYREEECLRDYVHPHGGVSATPVQQYNNITVTWQDAENAVRERSIKFAKDQKESPLKKLSSSLIKLRVD